MGGTVSSCFVSQPSYARYSNSKENVPELENVVGSLLEMDPALHDRDEGVQKINTWVDEISEEVQMTGPQLEISRWKCIKYWEAQHVSDAYVKDKGGSGLKLTGSCVRFYFEGSRIETAPRLVIEHCGRSLQMRGSTKSVPLWMKNMKFFSWKPFHKPVNRHESFASYNNEHANTEMLTTRNG